MKELYQPDVEKQDWSPPRIKKLPAPDTHYGGGEGNDGLNETSQMQDVSM